MDEEEPKLALNKTFLTVESASVDFGLFSAWLSRLCPFLQM